MLLCMAGHNEQLPFLFLVDGLTENLPSRSPVSCTVLSSQIFHDTQLHIPRGTVSLNRPFSFNSVYRHTQHQSQGFYDHQRYDLTRPMNSHVTCYTTLPLEKYSRNSPTTHRRKKISHLAQGLGKIAQGSGVGLRVHTGSHTGYELGSASL